MSKILSIEVGDSLTKIVEMDYRSKAPKIYKYLTLQTPKGVYDDGYLRDVPAIAKVIKDALLENKIKTKAAVCTVASSKIATREIMLPMVKEAQVESVIRANSTDYFPIDLSEFELGHINFGPVTDESGATKLKVMVMAAAKDLLNCYKAMCEAAGLKMLSADYVGNSVFQMMKSEMTDETEMVLRIEEHTTVATIITSKKMALQRNIAYGLEGAFDSERFLNIDTDRIDVSEVYDELTPLINNVSRLLDLYNSKNVASPITKVSIVGIGAEIAGLSELLTRELEVKTVSVEILKSINWAQVMGVGSSGEYVTAMGAALAPVGFISEEKKMAEKTATNYFNLSLLIAIFTAALCAAMVVMSVLPYRQAVADRDALKSKEQAYQKYETLYNTYTAMQAFYNDAMAGVRATEGNNDSLVAFLEELEKTLPEEALVSQFSSGETEAVLTLSVENIEEAAKIISKIREFDSLEGVSTSAFTVTEEDKCDFTLTCIYKSLEDSTEE